MGAQNDREILTVAGREVAISNPGKVLFPAGRTHEAGSGALLPGRGGGRVARRGRTPERPRALSQRHRGRVLLPEAGADSRPDWIEVVTLRFPSGRSAEEVVPRDAAALLWMANLACLELHPHPVRADDLDHPDELRVDLDPVPGIEWSQVREVAAVVQAALSDLGLVGWPKTSGSRGMHIYVRIAQRWTFDQVRRAALALAREVERRAPALATSKWWKEERHGVFLDYNQNAKDRTIAAAYSVRPRPDARVSAPLDVGRDRRRAIPRTSPSPRCPRDSPASAIRHAAMDRHVVPLDTLLELAARHERDGLGDAPWPPHYRKQQARTGARAAVHAAAHRRGRSSRSHARSGRKMRSRGSTAGRSGTRRRRSTSSRPTCSSMRCADASGPGRGSASIWSTSRDELRPAQERAATPDEKTWRRTPSRARRGRDLELIVAAVAGRLSGRQRRKTSRLAEASPCMWSYLTSHTRSIRSGSHDRSLPALHRLWPPGMRVAVAVRRRRPTRATDDRRARSSRSGSSSLGELRRVAIVNDDVTPT